MENNRVTKFEVTFLFTEKKPNLLKWVPPFLTLFLLALSCGVDLHDLPPSPQWDRVISTQSPYLRDEKAKG